MVIALLIIYYVLPKRFRWLALLAGSVYFYARVIDSWKQAAVFLLSIAVSYAAGLLLQKLNSSNNTRSAAHAGARRAVLLGGIILSALPLLLVAIR